MQKIANLPAMQTGCDWVRRAATKSHIKYAVLFKDGDFGEHMLVL